ncbi:MAG TPA: hypothetical protein VMT64_13500 [Candidatus Binataceae bacterium]|nr:hypothetical protein [Candidatus Binataceae bacterium]
MRKYGSHDGAGTGTGMTRQGSHAMHVATTDRSGRKEAALRVLILDASPSCRFTIATSDSIGDSFEKVEVTEASRAELELHTPDDWDIIITHIHENPIERQTPGTAAWGRRFSEGLRPEESLRLVGARLRGETVRGWKKIFGRFRVRGERSPSNEAEQRATQTMVLADIQRQIGLALSAIEMGDFDAIGDVACRLRDDATGYDFPRLSGLGAALLDTVPGRDIRTARNIAQKLMTYMGKTIGYYLS